MNKQQGKIPQIRFPEFKEVWEHKYGREVFKPISDKNHKSDLPILAISQEFGAVPRELINYQISVTEKSIESYKVIEVGDFIISLRSFQGGIEYSNYKGICSPAYIILRPYIEIDRLFFKFYFKTYKYIQDLNSKLEGIRDGKMINYKYFSEIAMPFPTLPEQTRIASFFTVLDKKIAQLKQKKTLLEQYKKGVMQKLFDVKTDCRPSLRFKDENGKEFPEWEKKKLGDMSVNIMYGMNAAAIPFDGYNKYIRITDIDENSRRFIPNPLTSPDCEIEEKYKLKVGDIVFARTGASVGKTYLYDSNDGNVVFAGFLIKFTVVKANPYFIFTQTFLASYNKWVLMMSMRSGQPGINAEEYKTLSIQLPCLQEQNKITNFLLVIDEKIKRTQEQIQQTQEWKKGLLQKMFC